MAFIVEDGTGVEDANALIDLNFLSDYASNRNIDLSAYPLDAQKQGAIVIASVDYCDTYFTFSGEKLNTDQGMQIPSNKVPLNNQIKTAIAMAAVLHLQGRLFVLATDVDRKALTSESKGVGPVSESKTYSENWQYTTKYPTGTIDRILNKYSIGGFGSLLRG